MAIEVYWGSGSPYSWRVLLALEYKRLAYVGHPLQFSRQEHKSPQILALNFRGRVPILKDGERLEYHIVVVAQHRQPAAKIHRQHLRRLMFLAIEVQQVALVGQTLEFERQRHAPARGTAASPVKVDRHWARL